MSRYRWVHHEDGRLFAVGVNDDGSVWNPNNYPEDVVRAAVAGADQRRREARSESAKKGAATAKRRRERRVHEISKAIVAGTDMSSTKCRLRRRALTDPEAIKRGIGSECWENVLRVIEETSAATLQIKSNDSNASDLRDRPLYKARRHVVYAGNRPLGHVTEIFEVTDLGKAAGNVVGIEANAYSGRSLGEFATVDDAVAAVASLVEGGAQ